MSDKLIVAAIQMDCVTNDRKANLARAEALVARGRKRSQAYGAAGTVWHGISGGGAG